MFEIWRWYNEYMSRTLYKKVKKFSLPECAYIAGIIDGEGSITLSVKQKGGTRHLALTISNTDVGLLQYLKKIIGAGKITTKRTYKRNHSPAYTYAIYSRQALSVLKQIYPYLRTYKLKRAKIVLTRYISVTPRNGKYNEKLRRRRERLVKDFFLVTQQSQRPSKF